jgi:hypothetical protein
LPFAHTRALLRAGSPRARKCGVKISPRSPVRLQPWSLGLPALHLADWIPLSGLIGPPDPTTQSAPPSRTLSLWCTHFQAERGRCFFGYKQQIAQGDRGHSSQSTNHSTAPMTPQCRAVVAEGMRRGPRHHESHAAEIAACLLWDGLLLLMAPWHQRISGRGMQAPPTSVKAVLLSGQLDTPGVFYWKRQFQPTNLWVDDDNLPYSRPTA